MATNVIEIFYRTQGNRAYNRETLVSFKQKYNCQHHISSSVSK